MTGEGRNQEIIRQHDLYIAGWTAGVQAPGEPRDPPGGHQEREVWLEGYKAGEKARKKTIRRDIRRRRRYSI